MGNYGCKIMCFYLYIIVSGNITENIGSFPGAQGATDCDLNKYMTCKV